MADHTRFQTSVILTLVMVMELLPIGGMVAVPGRYPTYDTPPPLLKDEAASILSAVQNSPGKITDPMMFRYCTDTTPDDCDDFMSGNGQCITLADSVVSGSFLILYPSKRCYLYPKMNCKGVGNYQMEDRWILANAHSIVSSYRCFK